MRGLGIAFLQVLLAVLVSALVLPAVLFAVPQARQVGMLALAALVAVLFVLLRVAWPKRRDDV